MRHTIVAAACADCEPSSPSTASFSAYVSATFARIAVHASNRPIIEPQSRESKSAAVRRMIAAVSAAMPTSEALESSRDSLSPAAPKRAAAALAAASAASRLAIARNTSTRGAHAGS